MRCTLTKSGSVCRLLAVLLLASAMFGASARGGKASRIEPHRPWIAKQNYPARPTPSQAAVPGSSPKAWPTPLTQQTEQYTLSEDRYEKAITYSRAEYVLYFVSYVVSVLALFLLLRMGVAAKFRDLAENLSG